eukprot:209534_1
MVPVLERYFTHKFKRRFFLFVEVVLYLIGIILLIQVFFVHDQLNNTFDSAASSRLVISANQQQQNTTNYQHWVANTCDDVCSIQLFNYYLFNITNPDAVRDQGAYPQLQELGPFVFNRYEIRTNVVFSADGTIVNYKYKYKFMLNEALTNMPLWNVSSWIDNQTHAPTFNPYPPIYILNPFMLAALNTCRVKGGKICNAVSLAKKTQLYFSNYTVQSILQTGMLSQSTALCKHNPLCNQTQKYIVDSDVYASEYTGTDDIRKMRELITFYGKNQTYAGWWDTEEVFAGNREPKQWPFQTISAGSGLKAWMMDKYRAVKLIRDGSFYLDELQLDKFIIDPREYLSAENNTNNTKYYQNDGIHDGLLNLTATNEANILQYTSKPYFLDAPYYVNQINDKMGLRAPNRSIDDTYFALDSKLGTVFKTRVTYQISFGIFPCEGCGLKNPFRNIPRLIVPQLYVVLEGGAPPASVEQYEQILALLDVTSQYSVYAGPTVAFVCFVIALYLSGKRYCRNRRARFGTLYMDGDHDWWELDTRNKRMESNENGLVEPTEYEEDNEVNRWDDSVHTGYARRDEDDPMMQYTNWKNTENTKAKKQTSASKLVANISSKTPMYSS